MNAVKWDNWQILNSVLIEWNQNIEGYRKVTWPGQPTFPRWADFFPIRDNVQIRKISYVYSYESFLPWSNKNTLVAMILDLFQFFALLCTSLHFCLSFILFCNRKTGTQNENLFIWYGFYSNNLADSTVGKFSVIVRQFLKLFHANQI